MKRRVRLEITYGLVALGEELVVVDEGSVDRDEASGWREEGRMLERGELFKKRDGDLGRSDVEQIL